MTVLETAFLGFRGLLIQAQKNNDRRAALQYAERAYELQPKTPWVLTTMFDLQVGGPLASSSGNVEEAVKRKAIGADIARDRRATVLLGAAQAEAAGDLSDALRFARRANTLAPDFLPAVLRTVDIMVRTDKVRPASRIIQNAGTHSHPALARIYGEIGDSDDALKRVKRYERCRRLTPNTRKPYRACRNCARCGAVGRGPQPLERAAGDDPSARVCRMMADLEERSGENPESARSWLLRASAAPTDPAWICRDCGAVGQLVAGLWGLRIACLASWNPGPPGRGPAFYPAQNRHR